MKARLTRLALFPTVAVLLLTAGSARAASLWTPLPSGTTQTISAIAVPKAGELVYTTTAGQIWYLSGSSFTQATVTPAAPLGFSAVAMSPDGTHGVAVGPAGKIYFSTNSGASWAPLGSPPSEPSGYCGNLGAPGTLGDALYSVKFADASTVYVTGANNDVLKSINGNTTAPTFIEVNKVGSNCIADPGGSGQAFGDTAWVTKDQGFLLSNDFGKFFITTDGLASHPNTTLQPAAAVNGFQPIDKLALDQADPTHAWVVNGGSGGSYFQYTTNTGTSWAQPSYDTNNQNFTDIAASGLTVVAVGTGGDIYTSGNGVNFSRQIAGAPYAATDWKAVAMVPGTNTAFVGGAGGALVYTTKANTVPDTTAPTGSISGPKTLAPNQYGTFTATVTDNPGGSGVDTGSLAWSVNGQSATGATAKFAFQNPGAYTIALTFKDLAGNVGQATFTVVVQAPAPSGSQPVTKSTGGTTITIYKHVTVTGRSARYIPVTLHAKAPRKFVVQLLTVKTKGKRQRTLSAVTTTLKHGTRTVHLKIGASVKSGGYELVVKVYTTGGHSHQTGKSVRQVFVLS